MAIPLTVAAMKRRVNRLKKADREDLWKELHDIGGFFALFGATQEAISVWEFAYSGKVPFPAAKDRTIHVNGDGAISAVCYHLKLPDLSKGVPTPKYGAPGESLEKRVRALDQWTRHSITVDAWSSCDWENPPLALTPTATYRKARLLAQPKANSKPSATERESLRLLQRLLAEAHDPAAFHPYYRLQGFLLAIDIAVRHGMHDEATRLLSQWYDYSAEMDNNSTVEDAFALKTVVGLLCDGVLKDKIRLSTKARTHLVTRLVSDLAERLNRPEPSKPPQWRYSLYVSYGQFYLEPKDNDLRAVYFQEKGESEQGFSAFPTQVAFGTPPNADRCTVEVEFGSKLPPLRSAVQAVAVPLDVESPDGLYLRTVDDSGDKQRLEVPPGQYDVVARFFPARRKRAEEDTCFSSSRVVLTLLPRGTVGPKCFKMPDGCLPESSVLHRNDRSRVGG
jgi:hypothetical protein